MPEVPPASTGADIKYLGWNIGGTHSSAIVGTSTGAILERRQWASAVQRGPEAMLDDFCIHANELLIRHDQISQLGISVGGPLDTRRGLVLGPPHLPGWKSIDLSNALRHRLHLSVTVEHDAVACLLAEHLWGAARGATHAIYLTCGTGFGAGIMIDGRILRGPTGQTPEIGHIRLAENGPDLFGKPGCAESFCSGKGIALLAQHLFPGRFADPVPVEQLLALSNQGDSQARAVLAASARWTGRACAMLGDIFSPQLIILGSLARYLPPWWLDAIKDEYHAEVLKHNGHSTRIVRVATGENLQDLSSFAACIFNQKQRPHHREPVREPNIVVRTVTPPLPAAYETHD